MQEPAPAIAADGGAGESQDSNVGSSGVSGSTDGGGLLWFWQSVESPVGPPPPRRDTDRQGSPTQPPSAAGRRRRWERAKTAGPQASQDGTAAETPGARDRQESHPAAPAQEPPQPMPSTFVVPRSSTSRLATGFPVSCVVCGWVGDASELRSHEIEQHRDHAFRCTCTKRYASSQDLRRHSRDTRHAIPAIHRLPAEEPFVMLPHAEARPGGYGLAAKGAGGGRGTRGVL